MEQTTQYPIRRSSSCFRPLHYLGTPFERIYFHDGNSAVIKIASGWLEHQPEIDFESIRGPKGGYDVIGINATPRNARKIDFSKKDHFIASFDDNEDGYWRKGKALYLYAPEIKTIKTIEVDNGTEVYSCRFVTIPLECEFVNPEMSEETELEESRLIWVARPSNHVTLQIEHKWTKTESGIALENLTKSLNEKARLELSTYQVERLLEHFSITEKQKEASV